MKEHLDLSKVYIRRHTRITTTGLKLYLEVIAKARRSSLTWGLQRHPESITSNDETNRSRITGFSCIKQKGWPWPSQTTLGRQKVHDLQDPQILQLPSLHKSRVLAPDFDPRLQKQAHLQKIRPETDHLWHLRGSELILLQSLSLSKPVHCFAPVQGQMWGDLRRMPCWRL